MGDSKTFGIPEAKGVKKTHAWEGLSYVYNEAIIKDVVNSIVPTRGPRQGHATRGIVPKMPKCT